ncbi:MAG: glycosyl hydrolase family 28-related protein [Verrucomicrobiales bacterium]|nr:glycosyl hydrolase family 28-related protein [Verrucomicrobiales bacterium]
MTRPCLFLLFLGFAIPAFRGTSATAQTVDMVKPILFPADGGILNVKDFGAIPDDDKDDTEAIQAALDEFPSGNRIIYLPPGIYIVRDTLKWAGTNSGNAQKRTILQGAGESLSILRLPDRTNGFRDKPKALIWTGNKPAQRFRNAVRDLTIEVGKDNPQAIGLQFNASNQGCIRNVTIRAANGAGKIGLDLGHTDEIGPLLVRNLTVEGFEIGISTKWPVNSNTFEHVHLKDQRRFGWWNYHQMVFVRGLITEGRVSALYNEKNSWGTVTLMDSHLHGVNAHNDHPGIRNQRHMVLNRVEVLGYRKAVDNDDKGRDKGDIDREAEIENDTSHKTVQSLFRKIDDQTFRTAGEIPSLPVKETPEVPWGNVARDWVNLIQFGGDPTGKKDSSAALQRAIDAGKKTVYLPAGANFRFDSAVRIRGPVERIIGLEGRFTTQGSAVWRLVDGEHPKGLRDAPVVVIERMTHRSGGKDLLIRQESARTLVVSSTIGFRVEGHGRGDLFLDDFCGHLDRLARGQSAWCRQLNSERKGVKCRNPGGKLWILGYKTESLGTLIETTQGGHTEVNGVFLYSNQPWDPKVPAFVIRDGTAVIRGINERNFNRSPVSLWFEETQGGDTRKLEERPWVYLSK